MPLGTKELYLVLRARDEASRVLRSASANVRAIDAEVARAAQNQIRHGAALASVGIGIATAGAVGLAWLNDSTNAAMEYNQAVATTYTQVDKVAVRLSDLSEIGLAVARDFPVPFEAIQKTFYDIFSSIDVTAAQSELLLRSFAKAAVAGQADMQVAGRATMAILNAYRLPAEAVTNVNDVMFKLVQKGVGTYNEFTKSIGRAIPSSVRAGQKFEDLAGMMAFLTRNGLSTSMAATSAARALDSMANPKTVKRMEAMGIKVRDAHGEFRSMVDISGQLADKLKGMTAPERAKALQELFKSSGGTIQARRFWDIVVKNPQALKRYTQDMFNAGGATDAAFKIMAKAPVSQMQQMQNRYQAMRVEIGNQLIPIKLKLIQTVSKLLKAWDRLSPNMKKWIAIGLAVVAALALVLGVVTALAGLLLMVAGAAALFGTSMLVVIGIGAAIIATFAAIGAAIFLVIKYHKEIQEWAQRTWSSFREWIDPAWQALKDFGQYIANQVWPELQKLWDTISNAGKKAWESISKGFAAIADGWKSLMAALKSDKADWFITMFKNIWNVVWKVAKLFAETVVSAIIILVRVIGAVLGPAIEFIGRVFGDLAKIVGSFFKLFGDLITGDFSAAWKELTHIFGSIADIGIAAFKFLWESLVGIVKALVTGVIDFFKHLWDVLVGHSLIPDLVKAILGWILNLHNKFIELIRKLIVAVVDWFKKLPGMIWDGTVILKNKLWDLAKQAFTRFNDAMISMATTIISYVKGIPQRIVDGFGKFGTLLYNVGRDIFNGLKNGMTAAVSGVVDAAKSIANKLVTAVKNFFGIHSPSKVFEGIGGQIMSGLWRGIVSNTGQVNKVLGHVFGGVKRSVLGLFNWVGKGKSKLLDMLGIGVNLSGVPTNVSGNAAIVRAVAASYGWFSGAQWAALYKLIMGESGFRNTAQNPNSTAYGMFQFLDGTWSAFGGHKTSDPYLQAIYGLRYIASTYGNPYNAYAKWSSRHPHWYEEGSWDTGARRHYAGIDPHEMIIPRGPAEMIRDAIKHAGTGGRNVKIEINVYTQEIDPRKHAAELGFEIAKRIGD